MLTKAALLHDPFRRTLRPRYDTHMPLPSIDKNKNPASR